MNALNMKKSILPQTPIYHKRRTRLGSYAFATSISLRERDPVIPTPKAAQVTQAGYLLGMSDSSKIADFIALRYEKELAEYLSSKVPMVS